MRRWVRAGSSGIALIRKSGGGRPRLEYVFDVSDTRPVQGAREPWLWELREEYHAAVVAALERRYGPTEETGVAGRLMDLADYAVREVYRDHLRDLAYDAEGSLLEGLDGLNLEVCFRKLMTGRLEPHLREIDRQAREQVDEIVSGLMKRRGVNEALKARDQMAWVRAVNCPRTVGSLSSPSHVP